MTFYNFEGDCRGKAGEVIVDFFARDVDFP